MKTKFLMLLGAIMVSTTALAQDIIPPNGKDPVDENGGPPKNSYYLDSQTFTGNGFAYRCDVEFKYVMLYNINNTFEYNAIWKNKDGSLISHDVFSGATPTIERYEGRANYIGNIIKSGFSIQDRRSMMGERLTVLIYFYTDSGKVRDIYFEFKSTSKLAILPPETFYKVEQYIRKNLQVKVTPAGQKLNFVMFHWSELI